MTNTRGQLQEKDEKLREKTQQLTNVEGKLGERDRKLLERKQKVKNSLTFQSTGMNPQRC